MKRADAGNGVMEQWRNGDIALDSVRAGLLKKTQRHPLLSTDPGRRSQCAGSAEAPKKKKRNGARHRNHVPEKLSYVMEYTTK